MLMHYLLFHQRDHPGMQTAATVAITKLLIEYRVTRSPHSIGILQR